MAAAPPAVVMRPRCSSSWACGGPQRAGASVRSEPRAPPRLDGSCSYRSEARRCLSRALSCSGPGRFRRKGPDASERPSCHSSRAPARRPRRSHRPTKPPHLNRWVFICDPLAYPSACSCARKRRRSSGYSGSRPFAGYRYGIQLGHSNRLARARLDRRAHDTASSADQPRSGRASTCPARASRPRRQVERRSASARSSRSASAPGRPHRARKRRLPTTERRR